MLFGFPFPAEWPSAVEHGPPIGARAPILGSDLCKVQEHQALAIQRVCGATRRAKTRTLESTVPTVVIRFDGEEAIQEEAVVSKGGGFRDALLRESGRAARQIQRSESLKLIRKSGWTTH